MKVRTIKGVDEDTWKIMKELAERRKLKMGILLKNMAREYKKNYSSKTLLDIIPKKPLLTAKEAEEMENITKKIRKEPGFREWR